MCSLIKTGDAVGCMGYNKKYDLVIISRSGQIGKVVEISNFKNCTT